MKKLFLILMLFISVISYSQKDHEILYDQVFRSSWETEQTLFELDSILNKVKITTVKSGLKMNLIRISDYSDSETEGGFVYYFAMYLDEFTEEEILMQIFKDDEYGIRLIYEDGRMVQYADKLSEE
jgi:hypothetical protein